MGACGRAVSALVLLTPLACAGPLEESGAFRVDAKLPGIPVIDAPMVARRVPGEPPLDVSREELVQVFRRLSSRLDRVAVDPDLARRRLLGQAEFPAELEGLLLDRAMEGRVVLASADLTESQQHSMGQQYFQHCQETHSKWGDCLNLMEGGRSLTAKARYRLACHFALASVWDGMKDELQGMLDLQRIESAIIVGLATWAALVVIPEPFSKLLAVGLTVAMMAWLGVDTLENVVGGWKDMVTGADRATTFLELRRAGEAYGMRMGKQTVRLVVMLVASVIAETSVANLPHLPKFNLATKRLAAATGGHGLEVVAEAQQATVTGTKITVVLAKAAKGVQAGAAMASAGAGQGGPGECKEEEHHIATVENDKATWNGGPWTPRFRDLFAKAGLSMNNKANLVFVFGHVGPHPEEYHRIVFKRLSDALEGCRTTDACRQALINELKNLADEIAAPGTELNKLVTQGCKKRN